MGKRRRCRAGLLIVAAILTAGCSGQAINITGQASNHWEQRGSWSGRGSQQTEAFPGETGGLRLTWTTRKASEGDQGSFTVAVHAAEGGQKLLDAIDGRSPANGTAFYATGPQRFYLVIDSKDVDWSVTVDESVP